MTGKPAPLALFHSLTLSLSHSLTLSPSHPLTLSLSYHLPVHNGITLVATKYTKAKGEHGFTQAPLCKNSDDYCLMNRALPINAPCPSSTSKK